MSYNTFPISMGQKVWMSPTGNITRNWDGQRLVEGTISKIARKYFYVEIGGHYAFRQFAKFDRKTFESYLEDRNSGYILWESRESFADFCRAQKELSELRKWIDKAECDARWYRPINTQLVHELYSKYKEES